MIDVQLHPVDTWFFRSGTPFEDTPWLQVDSLFPPYPPTLVGALRAAIARENGWNGRGGWSPRICKVLGDGPEDLGRISIDGPFLLRNGRPLYRVPRHLLGVIEIERWRPEALLRPGEPVECDLGRVRLPDLFQLQDGSRRPAPGKDQWLAEAGMNAVLTGKTPRPEDVVPSSHLWKAEPRIGLQRDARTRTAREGMLFNTGHVRLRSGVSIGARIAGLPQAWIPPSWDSPAGQVVPIGGESRFAVLRRWAANPGIEPLAGNVSLGAQVAVIALTPMDIAPAACRGEAPIEELGGARVVSACLDRPMRIGGWDSRGKAGPLPIRSTLPPGSVLFCEIGSPQGLEHIATTSNGLVRIGARTRSGFGLSALGIWPGHEERT